MSCCGRTRDDTEESPIKPRQCTDLLCLVIFVLFWALLIFVAAFAFVIGSPLRFIHGSDSFGNVCGYRNAPFEHFELSGRDMSDKPFLFHMDISKPRESIKICVKQCPRERLSNLAEIYRFYTETGSSLCRYDYNFSSARPYDPFSSRTIGAQFDRNTYDMGRYASTGPCPTHEVAPTIPVLYHCIPNDAIYQAYSFGNSIYEFLLSYGPLKKVINDLINSWREIILMIIIALFTAFFVAFTIHFVASIASWIIMIVVSVSLFALTVFLWYAYIDIRLQLNSIPFDKVIPIVQDDQNNEQIILFIAIGTTVASTILLLITFALRSGVKLVVALFKESSSCIRSMPLLLIQPIWTLLAMLIFFIFWISVFLALITAEHAEKEQRNLVALRYDDDNRQILPSDTAQLASFTLIDYKDPSWIQYMWWYLIIAFFWTSEFILSCQQMVIAGAVSSWYFSRDRSQLVCPIGRSIRRLILYHLGSVAMGSFLITLLKVPRLIILYMEKRLKGFHNFAARCCLRCCACCLWMIERFVKYLNHNAYTVIAMEGTGFCTAAGIAFNAIVSNALRVATINSVGDFILFLGKICVAAITAFVGSIFLKHNQALHYWTIPVLLVTILSFWIAHCILSIYEMVIDTIFLCFCEDYNKNDGTPGKEYYAPPSLMAFLTGEELDTAMTLIRKRSGGGNSPQS